MSVLWDQVTGELMAVSDPYAFEDNPANSGLYTQVVLYFACRESGVELTRILVAQKFTLVPYSG